jgi:uncharacterized LabA/DUF88 family protein
MKDLTIHKKIAVLIDSDNAKHSKLKAILDEIALHGHIVIKRAYGDWSSSCLSSWKKILNELAIQAIQQCAYTKGKNATDIAMVIDAMDLLYEDRFDAFVLVSSDSDFTRLAIRLRESEISVFGVGEKKTPVSFRNACDDFIFTEDLVIDEAGTAPASKLNENDQQKPVRDMDELIPTLEEAWRKHQNDEGWANVAAAGSFIKRAKPDFNPESYGVSKLPEIIGTLKEKFEMKKFKGKNNANIVAYRSNH